MVLHNLEKEKQTDKKKKGDIERAEIKLIQVVINLLLLKHCEFDRKSRSFQ